MENIEKEKLPNPHFARLDEVLGEKKSESFGTSVSSQERYQLFITRDQKGGFVVEFLEPGNVHNVFLVNESETAASKQQKSFADGAKEEAMEPELNLDEVLDKFSI